MLISTDCKTAEFGISTGGGTTQRGERELVVGGSSTCSKNRLASFSFIRDTPHTGSCTFCYETLQSVT